eukprot:Tbor_TRINITY_DN5436_c0_g2::TRINITY_DN5436_c0_g2_i1::g.24901::m.24901/K08288/PRKCSH; protein kinase C substrate 80K-H
MSQSPLLEQSHSLTKKMPSITPAILGTTLYTSILLLLYIHPVIALTPRGVMPEYASKYPSSLISKEQFKCFSGGWLSSSMPADKVNDGYCDCSDGSDEPGTAACSWAVRRDMKWRFQCTGSQQRIPHSKVSDGYCDCCDGSDEYEGHVVCEDTCAVMAQLSEAEDRAREASRQRGLAAKEGMIVKAREARHELEKRLAEELVALEVARSTADSTRAAKEAAEVLEQKERDTLKAKYEAEHAEYMAQKAANHADYVRALKEAPAPDLKEGTISMDCISWEQTSGCVGHGALDGISKGCKEVISNQSSGYCMCVPHAEAPESQQPKVEEKVPHNDQHDEDKLDNVDVDDEGDEHDGDRRNAKEHTNAVHLYRDCGHRDLTCDYVCRYGVDGLALDSIPTAPVDDFRQDTSSTHEVYEARAARDNYDTAVAAVSKLESSIEGAKQEIARGTEDEAMLALSVLKGECFETSDREYSYKLCPFDKMEQVVKSNEAVVSLGKWKGFAKQTYGSWAGAEDKSKMEYDSGTQCWNGPVRSTNVVVKCGEGNALVSVQELSVCSYTAVFETPAVCE